MVVGGGLVGQAENSAGTSSKQDGDIKSSVKPDGDGRNIQEKEDSVVNGSNNEGGTPPPQSFHPSSLYQQQQQAYPQQQYPNQTGYYPYPVHNNNSELQSPTLGSSAYDVQAALFQQQSALFNRSFGAGFPNLPLSAEGTAANSSNTGGMPAGSPIFAPQAGQGPPPVNSTDKPDSSNTSKNINAVDSLVNASGANPNVGTSYLNTVQGSGAPSSASAIPGYSGVYQGYTASTVDVNGRGASSPTPIWPDRSMQPQFYQHNIGSTAYTGVPFNPTSRNGTSDSTRAQSFEDMLSPVAAAASSTETFDQQYSQYQQSMANSTGSGSGNVFAPHHQPWGFPPGDMYSGGVNVPHSSLMAPPTFSAVASRQEGDQMNQGLPHSLHHKPGPSNLGRGAYHQHQVNHPYYQHASITPGPPIQNSPSNKGPDGANLFIFHIPNHFTNYDMYELFKVYGYLLSVRIMVEKDTGRSRGFGFVSYDNPESAARAIKDLNGFVIGNKRLKVQHKQIRTSDHNTHNSNEVIVSIPHDESPSDPEGSASSQLSKSDISANNAVTSTNTGGLNQMGSMLEALPDVSN